ncbi:MAG: glycosyltransferase [Bacteroidaceae bacterium]|nr:glycosyltransferase [Bacteroidaceae bacterium]
MHISVIICTYNREKYIYNVMKSIAEGNYPVDKYEIVFVDNNCTDGTCDEVERFAKDYPQVNLKKVKEKAQGLSHARNRGIIESSGDILIYVDDDATVNKEYLSVYDAFFAANPGIDAAGGPYIPHYEEGDEPKWMTYHLRRLLTGYLYFGDKEKPFPGDNYPGGGNAAYRRHVFEKVGPYNVELGRNGGNLAGGEEKDIFDKMKTAGMSFRYLPDAILYHSIPKYKLEPDYFNRLTCGIGESERLRTKKISQASYIKRLAKEAVKWGGTLVLWVYYLLTLRPSCGNMLVRFRWNVTRNLLGI